MRERYFDKEVNFIKVGRDKRRIAFHPLRGHKNKKQLENNFISPVMPSNLLHNMQGDSLEETTGLA